MTNHQINEIIKQLPQNINLRYIVGCALCELQTQIKLNKDRMQYEYGTNLFKYLANITEKPKKNHC